MSELRWNADRFGSELAATLTAALAGARSFPALITAVTECAAAAEAASSGRSMACAAGCPYCCVLNVAILLPEGMIIAAWMRERLSPPELAAVQRSLAAHRSWARWMDDEERILKHMTCPLLDEAGCYRRAADGPYGPFAQGCLRHGLHLPGPSPAGSRSR